MRVICWNGVLEKLVGLGSESRNSSGVSNVEFLNLELVLIILGLSCQSLFVVSKKKTGQGKR